MSSSNRAITSGSDIRFDSNIHSIMPQVTDTNFLAGSRHRKARSGSGNIAVVFGETAICLVAR